MHVTREPLYFSLSLSHTQLIPPPALSHSPLFFLPPSLSLPLCLYLSCMHWNTHLLCLLSGDTGKSFAKYILSNHTAQLSLHFIHICSFIEHLSWFSALHAQSNVTVTKPPLKHVYKLHLRWGNCSTASFKIVGGRQLVRIKGWREEYSQMQVQVFGLQSLGSGQGGLAVSVGSAGVVLGRQFYQDSFQEER